MSFRVHKTMILIGSEWHGGKHIVIAGSDSIPKHCCPKCGRKRKKAIGDVIQYGFEGDLHYTVLRCVGCRHEWVVEYSITHYHPQPGNDY